MQVCQLLESHICLGCLMSPAEPVLETEIHLDKELGTKEFKTPTATSYITLFHSIDTRVVVMVVCNCNRLQLITNSYVIVILIVIDDNFV